MKKKIAILGSTGSIGENTLKIIHDNKKSFQIDLLSTNKNIKKIKKQVKSFNVKNLIIHDEKVFNEKKLLFEKQRINV